MDRFVGRPVGWHSRTWRAAIVGAALAALLRSPEIAGALVEALARGSWVAPQLAAALAPMGQGADLTALHDVLHRAPGLDAKTVMSAYAALAMLGDPAAAIFERRETFTALWRSNETRWWLLAVRWEGIWALAGSISSRREWKR